MPEITTLKNLQTPSGEWVTIRTRQLVPADDPRLPTKADGYVKFNNGMPKPAEGDAKASPAPPVQAAAEDVAARQSSRRESAGQLQRPAVDRTVDGEPLECTIPNKELTEANMKNESEYEDQYEEEDDDRPWQVTKQTFGKIDSMSPSELETLIENIQANEEWEELRERAKKRTAQWLGAIKKAEEAPRCQYLKTNGRGCGSPAMKDAAFCYFHGEARTKRQAEETSNLQEVPILEDRLSLQLAITRLCAQLTAGSIDEKVGRVLLAALRLAQKNLGDGSSLYGW